MKPRPRTWITATSTIRGSPQAQSALQAPRSYRSMFGSTLTCRPCPRGRSGTGRAERSRQNHAGAEDHEPLLGRRDGGRHLAGGLGDHHGPCALVLAALKQQGAVEALGALE